MKQQKLTDYRPNYPRKVLRGATMAAAALVVLGVSAGCRRAPEVQTEGIVAMPEPTEEVLVLDGEVAIPEEELTTEGMVAVPDREEPTERPLLTTGLPLMCTPQP